MNTGIFRKKSLSIRGLLEIDAGRIGRSKILKDITVENVYSILDENLNLWRKIMKYVTKKQYFYKVIKLKVTSNSGSKYTVIVQLSPNFSKKRFLDNEIAVFCTCPDFKFRSAYKLKESGNLFYNQSIINHLEEAFTDAPKIATTNTCKHIYACVKFIYDNYERLDLNQIS